MRDRIPSMTSLEKEYEQYAELLIQSGINLPQGGNLLIHCKPESFDFARICAKKAYELGAHMVEFQIKDMSLIKARLQAQSGNEEALGAHPDWLDSWQKAMIDQNWSFLALPSFEDLGLMADANQQDLALFSRLQQSAMEQFHNDISTHNMSWCVGAVPGPRWAEAVLGSGATTEELWEVLKPILLLNKENPVQAWREKADALVERGKKLDALSLDSLRFEDEGTNLTVGLNPGSLWKGGPEEARGRRTMPNIPTEEVFTTPHRMRCDGTARVTRPVEIRGTMTKGVTLTFKDGLVVDFDAQEGREALAGYLDTDAGAKRLGEVALVGADSPIAKSGYLFSSILYDENAACHIALGSGYPTCIEGYEDFKTEEDSQAAGCNTSIVHTDFMIGSPTMTVTGIDQMGKEIPIMEQGKFVI
ncbi:MAG: aminopeptidase [Spirochaetales bacterium]|nr:aminopeptidase [Spirochaetales bacterium]